MHCRRIDKTIIDNVYETEDLHNYSVIEFNIYTFNYMHKIFFEKVTLIRQRNVFIL